MTCFAFKIDRLQETSGKGMLKMKTTRRCLRRLFGVAFAGVAIGAAAEPPQGGEKPFRPPAVPLVCVEPHFSLWSAADRLTDADTTFWAGQRQSLSVLLTADGVQYRLCGRTQHSRHIQIRHREQEGRLYTHQPEDCRRNRRTQRRGYQQGEDEHHPADGPFPLQRA